MDRKSGYALTVLLILAATLFAVPPEEDLLARGQVGSEVGGVITTDTVWTPQGSPYVFVDTVTVVEGITLTIKPGTTVDLQLASFIIDGTLIAQGNETNTIMLNAQKRSTYSWPPRIFFNYSSTPWDETTGTGCVIDYAQISVPTFQYEAILGGNPKISNNIVYNYGNDAAAIRTNGLVINNTIFGGYRGIEAENGSIYYNFIRDASVGIACGFGSPDPIYHPTIIGNYIVNNTIGIEDWGSHLIITNNTVIDNQVGFRFTSYTFYRGSERKDVNYNNIYGNGRAVLVEFDNTQRTINMINNWWGTTDQSTIAQSIYNSENATSLNTVTFVPFLNQAVPHQVHDVNSTMPTVPPTNVQTPTPTPQSTPEPNTFSVESNSTVSALSFNSTTSEISFTVSGSSGTTGYVKATVSKSIMPDGEAIQVYLDENPINCTVSSSNDSWTIYFSYNHSFHSVRIDQRQTSPQITLDSEYLPYILVGVIVVLVVFLCLIVWIAKSERSPK